MQFPYYFGENWDAFRDCLLDLEWLPGEAHGVIVTNSHGLLEESSKDLEILFDDLEEAGSEFKQQGKRFITLFQYEGDKETEVYKTLESVGLFFKRLILNRL